MVEAPELPHHHAHKTGLPWFDLVVPIAVLCISVASLLTSLQSEKSMHALVEENRRLVTLLVEGAVMAPNVAEVDANRQLYLATLRGTSAMRCCVRFFKGPVCSSFGGPAHTIYED